MKIQKFTSDVGKGLNALLLKKICLNLEKKRKKNEFKKHIDGQFTPTRSFGPGLWWRGRRVRPERGISPDRHGNQ